jgi:L-glyceraldehyde 3-phosphate reductase
MAIAWLLRDQPVSGALIGARSVKQIEDSLDGLDFAPSELEEIDRYAIDLWKEAREG